MNSQKVNNGVEQQEQTEKLVRITNTIAPQNLAKISPISMCPQENIIPFTLFQKMESLYSSILDAKIVLSNYKADLSKTVLQDGCLTPLSASAKKPMVFYKREDLTTIGAYKVRGALYQMSKIIEENSKTSDDLSKLKFVAASTGNHALGVLKAAEILKVSNVAICISKSVTEFKREKLEKRISQLRASGLNARLILVGENFDETNKSAKQLAQGENSFYIDPYNKHNAVAGQGTIGVELLSQLNNQPLDFDVLKELTVVVPIGGGGLISGISCALKAGMKDFPNLKNVALKVVGVKLDDLSSKLGDAIKVKTVGEHNNEYINYFVQSQEVINDVDMQRAIEFVAQDLGVNVEGASAGTLKPVFDNVVTPSEQNAVICVLSGSNS